ncbi:MAG: phytanoyl-CoA dioxygenase family protein [Pseudomonadota bacterium]
MDRSFSPSVVAERFERDGFVFPIPVLATGEALAARDEFLGLMASDPRTETYSRTHTHLIFPLVDRITRNGHILDAVEAVLGPDILLWGAGFFLKPPMSESYISWHQDLKYWGLDGTDEVTAWLALSVADEANGCMRFVPGSHRRGMVAHADTFADTNMLTRGQEIAVDVEEGDAVPVVLRPGELSLHHGRMFHASGANRTDAWRVGLAMQYITPAMRQVVASRDYAQLVRGEDSHGHFQPLPRPRMNFDPEGLAAYKKVTLAQREALYQGAAQRPDDDTLSA